MRRAHHRLARTLRVVAVAAIVLTIAGCASPRPAADDAAAAAAKQDYRSLGRADAPVTVVEYTDLQCSFCGRHARSTFVDLKRLYIDPGKVRYVSRDLPLSFHPFSLPAAIAARCAGEQGRYWPYREILAQRQDDLRQAPYDAWAADLKLDAAKFSACRASPDVAQAIRSEAVDATAAGIKATPTFVIYRTGSEPSDGAVIEGAKPLDEFERKIDELLAITATR